jgi:hypothetical protein
LSTDFAFGSDSAKPGDLTFARGIAIIADMANLVPHPHLPSRDDLAAFGDGFRSLFGGAAPGFHDQRTRTRLARRLARAGISTTPLSEQDWRDHDSDWWRAHRAVRAEIAAEVPSSSAERDEQARVLAGFDELERTHRRPA